MSPVEYPFDVALSAMFELPYEVARELLPEHPEPIEVVHGQAALAVRVFDFTTSPVGPYRELALAVLVAPRVDSHHVVPHAAFHTFLLAATNQVAREHAIDLWHDERRTQGFLTRLRPHSWRSAHGGAAK